VGLGVAWVVWWFSRVLIRCVTRTKLDTFSLLALCVDDVQEREQVAAALGTVCRHLESRLDSSIFDSKPLDIPLRKMEWNKVANAEPVIEMLADLDEAGLREILKEVSKVEKEEREYVEGKLAQRRTWDVRISCFALLLCVMS
jgi:hypothetical protein